MNESVELLRRTLGSLIAALSHRAGCAFLECRCGLRCDCGAHAKQAEHLSDASRLLAQAEHEAERTRKSGKGM